MNNERDELLVQVQYMNLKLSEGGFELSSGEVLKEIEVAYETYGELSAQGDNVVFVCHTLTGDSHAAGRYETTDKDPGWWDPLIGPGKAIDTNKYHVVCPNILGGCKGTTGPLSINPDTNRPYAATFPLIQLEDVIRVHKLFLDQLGIPELYAVIGGSLGGMQALEWAVRYPDFVKRCICIAAGANLSPQALAFDIIARQVIENDPNYVDGNYHETGQFPGRGLARARQIGHVTYLSSHSMAIKFGRDEREERDERDERDEATPTRQRGKFSTDFQVEAYLQRQGSKFIERFDANTYLYVTRMMDMFDLTKEDTLTAVLRNLKSRFLIVSISSDWLFPPEQQLELVGALLANRKDVSYFQIDSPYGHDAFLIEYEILNPGIDAFLNGRMPEDTDSRGSRMDVEHVSHMMDAGSHVLDVGSGEGDFVATLVRDKHITGTCLDLDFKSVVQCMKKGLPALQLDADSGLELVADDSFDCVLLNQTIQQLHSALLTMKQMLRIAPAAVIGFPNFAYYRYRISLGIRGRLPISTVLPYQWYESPNIHLVTIKEFTALCQINNFTIEDVHYLADDFLGKLFLRLGVVNAGSERVLVKLRR